MSERNYRLYIEDIKKSAEAILEYTAGMDEQAFKADKKTVDAVIRNFEVIGEASNRVPQEIKDKAPEVPWRDIIDFRNRITHEYFGISI
ncbi:MAG TPA: DUF86 domain-containing protein, partial [Firmicutes bacterium]|nr:DUF86 domain-containing protein [Bacillota bacterium]